MIFGNSSNDEAAWSLGFKRVSVKIKDGRVIPLRVDMLLYGGYSMAPVQHPYITRAPSTRV